MAECPLNSVKNQKQFNLSKPKPNHRLRKIMEIPEKKQNHPYQFNLSPFADIRRIVQDKKLYFFIDKLKIFNEKIKHQHVTQTQQEIHYFLYKYLLNILGKSKDLQLVLLNKLYLWYQEYIDHNPPIIDIIQTFLKNKNKQKFTQDDFVLNQFKKDSNLSLKDFYRRKLQKNSNSQQKKRVLMSINRVTLEPLSNSTVIRPKKKKQYNINTWREMAQKDLLIGGASSQRSRRLQSNLNTFSKFSISTITKRELLKTVPCSKIQDASKTIFGLTLMSNPFQGGK